MTANISKGGSSSEEEFHSAAEIESNSDIVELALEEKEEEEEEDDDEYQSSDDEAPEEEDVNAGKNNAEVQERELEKLEAEKKKNLKERRRTQDLKFKEQKQNKTQRKKLEVPDLLPQELLENLDSEEEQEKTDQQSPKNKHTTFKDDYEDEDEFSGDDQNLAQQLKKTKLKLARQMKKQHKTIGSINVKLLKSKNKTKLPPAAVRGKQGTIDMRGKWLKRRSLAKKLKN
ncbi:Bud21 protein [Saccharomycopsis crataegensis]|uniref:Bud21 protein n=1 Tax=Saccharomycopsis crataegensis TaxID=43959 RepID=A0AAV5QDA6_9ASCO|nr:Bud21 protein [Saccharomycopsis crataegensis]